LGIISATFHYPIFGYVYQPDTFYLKVISGLFRSNDLFRHLLRLRKINIRDQHIIRIPDRAEP